MAENKGREAPHPAPPRAGPRPLPLHLATEVILWLSSCAALRQWNAGSLPWRPEIAAAAAALRRELERHDPSAAAAAVEAEGRRRLAALIDGILAYRRHPYRRDLAEPPTLWQEGTTRLLDYGAHAAAPAVLFVPSLVNRSYVLDLSARRSLLRWLAARGIRPLLVDWGSPAAEERRFTLTDYVAGRLERALDAAMGAVGRPLPVAGYCMGGNLALALALRQPQAVSALALLATPWDFHAGGGAGRVAAALSAMVEPVLQAIGVMPVDLLQAMFAALDPGLVSRKFQGFATLDPRSARARDFVALEDWLNDGIPLAAPVARECLVGWYGHNSPARSLWRIAGQPVDPGCWKRPAWVVIPARDHIVPPDSAAALAAAIPHARRTVLPAGHIGMVVGGRARSLLWQPLLAWIRRFAPR